MHISEIYPRHAYFDSFAFPAFIREIVLYNALNGRNYFWHHYIVNLIDCDNRWRIILHMWVRARLYDNYRSSFGMRITDIITMWKIMRLIQQLPHFFLALNSHYNAKFSQLGISQHFFLPGGKNVLLLKRPRDQAIRVCHLFNISRNLSAAESRIKVRVTQRRAHLHILRAAALSCIPAVCDG